MAWKEKNYHLKSVCPMLTHNGQGVDPLNKFTKALKILTSKRIKTDEDLREIARIEFLSGLYMGENGPILPAENVESMLTAAAKKFKEGNLAKSGMYVKSDADLIYEGSKNPEEMFLDDSFRDTRGVAIKGRNRIMRTRPIYPKWEAIVTIVYEDTVVNGSRIDEWMHTAGTFIGLCEMRPRLGRFEII
jgi:hypothetical protein